MIVMLLTEMSSYNNAVQQYGKDVADFWSQFDFSSTKRYVKKMCDLFYIEKIPKNEIAKIFRYYQENEDFFDAIGINFNQLSWDKLNELVLRQIGEYEKYFQLPNQFFESNDKLISIGYFNTFEEAMSFEPKNGWCICVNQGRFEEHHDINHEMLYIIRNWKLSKASNCRFVVAQVNLDGTKVYWDQKDNRLGQTSDGKHISVGEYEITLGDAVNQLQPMHIENNNNEEIKENRNMNKKTSIRLFERIAGEKGMNDAEVMRRRNDNFIKDMDSVPNSLWDNPYEPNYGDSVEMNGWFETPEETQLKVARDRLNRHRLTQNHITNNEEIKENRNMNKKQVIRINESQLRQIVTESVKRVLNEGKPPFLDSELATGDHERCANYRVTSVIREFTLKLRQAIIDDEYGDNIDKMFVPKVDQAIRKVLAEYGIPN